MIQQMNNNDKSKISYQHADSIQKIFRKHIKGAFEIDHFSLNVFVGHHSFYLSSTPEMADKLCSSNCVDEDSCYKPEIYKQLPVYPWRYAAQNRSDDTINFIKEEKFGMRSGMMFVRALGNDKYLMYSIATHRPDNPGFPGQFYWFYQLKAAQIFAMGDFFYNQLLSIVNNYTSPLGFDMDYLNENNIMVPKSLSIQGDLSDYLELVMRKGSLFTQISRQGKHQPPPILRF